MSAAFGPAAGLARRYAELLVQEAIPYGLLGPREAGVVWSRHLLNCAAVADIIPVGADVVDVGSGAGLPGIPLALACPLSQVTLVEPLLRRTRWLTTTVSELGLEDRVQVVRGRIQDQGGRLTGDVVTARAVADLGRLVAWSAPAVRPDGALLALRGARAAVELAEAEGELRRLRAVPELISCGGPLARVPTTVVRIRFPRPPGSRARSEERGP